jgi:hypothetical protein
MGLQPNSKPDMALPHCGTYKDEPARLMCCCLLNVTPNGIFLHLNTSMRPSRSAQVSCVGRHASWWRESTLHVTKCMSWQKHTAWEFYFKRYTT